jgi:putative two-component system response regulator
MPLKSFRSVLPIIRHHHEKLDGSGYPDGLTGDNIPITARILSVVDVFDALTSERSYRTASPPDEAIRIMLGEVEKGWWDGRLVKEFAKVVTTGAK